MPRWGALRERVPDALRDLGPRMEAWRDWAIRRPVGPIGVPLPLILGLAGTIAAFMAALFGLDHWDLLYFQPHPLWLLVLITAVTFGAPAGSIVGGLVALSYLFVLWTAPASQGEALRSFKLLQPLLLFIGAVLASDIVSIQRQRLRNVERKYNRMADALKDVTERHLATVTVKEELEKRIAGQPATVATLYEASKKLETLRVAELPPAILELISSVVDADPCALYFQQDGELRLQAGRAANWAESAATLARDSIVARRALDDTRVVSLRDVEAAPPEAATEQVTLAGPLTDRTGQVIGLVVVGQVPFVKLTPAAQRLFGLIVDWSSTALQNALLYEQTRERSSIDELTQTYTAAYTTERLREDFLQARRHRLPLSVVLLEVDDYEAVAPERQSNMLQAIGRTLVRRRRRGDTVGRHADPDKFVYLLPVTPIEGARRVIDRIAEDLRRLECRPYGDDRPLSVRFGLASLSAASATAEALMAEALADLEAWEEPAPAEQAELQGAA